MRKRFPDFFKKIRIECPEQLFSDIICFVEKTGLDGAALREDFETFWSKLVKLVISQVQVIPLGPKEGILAGDILARLRKKGRMIGLEDILISATALSYDLVLVPGNTRHFSKVEGLKVENWLA